MTMQSQRDADRQEREARRREQGQTAFSGPSWWQRNFGGVDPTHPSERAQKAWDSSMDEFIRSGRYAAQNPLGRLDDQSRTAAYDPMADYPDPRNAQPVDFSGRTLWDNGPMANQGQPVTKLSTAPAIAKKINATLQPQPSSNYDVPPDAYSPDRGVQPQFSDNYDVPPDAQAAPAPQAYAGTRYPDEDYLPPSWWPTAAAVAPSVPPRVPRPVQAGMIPPAWLDAASSWYRRKKAEGGPVGYAEGGRPDLSGFMPLTAFGGPGKVSAAHAVVGQNAPMPTGSLAGARSGGADDGFRKGANPDSDIDQQIADWSKYYDGGPVRGYAQGGMFEGDMNTEGALGMLDPAAGLIGGILGGGKEGGGGLGDIAKLLSPLGMLLGGGGGGGLFAHGGPVGYAGGGGIEDFLGGDALGGLGKPQDDDDFKPLSAFGAPSNIGESHAVVGQNAPAPSMGGGGGGGGSSGGGGGGFGDILKMGMSILPAVLPMFSDERLKDNIKPVGKTRSGMKAIQFNYKGSPHTQIGLSAQDVEKKRPEAVGEVGGYKTVDYKKALMAFGGPIPMMRGGYPELYTRPTRKTFSTGGGDNYVRPDGRGNGRSDHIDASLSPGEFVMDAETVSLAGDGDNDAGARQMENLRKNIRVHKGRQLAKGKFSPKAKPVESYMSPKLTAADRAAHAGMSEGLGQIGRRK
jgi:hypothetical protein